MLTSSGITSLENFPLSRQSESVTELTSLDRAIGGLSHLCTWSRQSLERSSFSRQCSPHLPETIRTLLECWSPLLPTRVLPSPLLTVLQSEREEGRKASVAQSVSAALHALSSQHPQSLYSIGQIDFAFDLPSAVPSWLLLPFSGPGERRIVCPLSTSTASWLSDVLSPCLSRWLIGSLLS
jgi:hypothetical protein